MAIPSVSLRKRPLLLMTLDNITEPVPGEFPAADRAAQCHLFLVNIGHQPVPAAFAVNDVNLLPFEPLAK
jgi:hypothetical protein